MYIFFKAVIFVIFKNHRITTFKLYTKFVLRPSDIEIIVEIINTGTIRTSVYS